MRAKFINETINFERKQDKMSSLGIGKRKLIEDWLYEMKIQDYIINDDLTIDSDNIIDLRRRRLEKFPDFIQFNEVRGPFVCSFNYLTSLKGCPKIVKGVFNCAVNKLNSLEGCPEYVDSHFICANNKIKFTEEDVKKLCAVKGEIRYES